MKFLRALAFGIGLAATLATVSSGQNAVSPQEHTMPSHAHGSFTVKLEPAPASSDGLHRMSLHKELHGGLEATSQGEMISAGNSKTGAAGYVAMETVSGKLDGKTGTFALQQFATMDAGGQKLQIVVVPGSGTGELAGIQGVFTITIANGAHSYDLNYTLPHGAP